MKQLIVFLLFAALLLSCKKQENHFKQEKQNILKVLNPKDDYKKVTTSYYFSRNGFCSNSIYLNSDSTYLNESGCEGNSEVTIGKWKIIEDSIELIPIKVNELNLVSEVEYSGLSNNNIKTIYLVDKTEEPISQFTINLLNKNVKNFTSQIIKNRNSKSKIKSFETDKNGYVQIDISKYDSISFFKLEKITNKKYRLSTRNLPDTIIIKLDINAYGILYSEPLYTYPETNIMFKYSKNKLSDRNFILKKQK